MMNKLISFQSIQCFEKYDVDVVWQDISCRYIWAEELIRFNNLITMYHGIFVYSKNTDHIVL